MLRVAFLLLLPLSLFAADASRQLRATYENQTVLLRGFYDNDRLVFGPTGDLISPAVSSSWTTSFVAIESIRLNGNVVEIKGRRAVQVFSTAQNRLEPQRTYRRVAIEIQLPDRTDASALNAVSRVLALPSEPLVSVVPDYWRPYIENPGVATSKPAPGCPAEPTPDQPCHLGSDVLPPIANSRPQPAYTQLAQELQCQGSTHLRLVVDATGAPSRVRIVRPVGCGLDDLAVRSIQRWTFQPATRNGQPVPVETDMLVKFRLAD